MMMSDAMQPLTIKANRGTTILVGLGLFLFGLLLHSIGIQNEPDPIERAFVYLILFFLLGIGALGIFKGLFGNQRLELDGSGLTRIEFGRRKTLSWHECSEFVPYKVKNAKLIGCRLPKPKRLMRALHGYDMVISLPGKNNVELAKVINAYRSAALGQAQFDQNNITDLTTPRVPEPTRSTRQPSEKPRSNHEPAVWRRVK